jgi:DNA-binding NarL/FixJ family response regulator
MKYSVVIVDDHLLFAQSLQGLINSFDEYKVVFHALNGKELQTKLITEDSLPDLVLLDINMPVMNGMETMEWLKENHPEVKVLALSMDDNEETIIKIIRKGARGYLLKDIHPEVFHKAMNEVLSKGFYYSERVNNSLLHALDKKEEISLKERELEFLKWACTELTYKEIAAKMFLSPKTIDGYREVLFEKLEVKSRIGLVLYAIKHKLFEV